MDKLSKIINEMEDVVSYIETTEFRNHQVRGDKFLVDIMLNHIYSLEEIRDRINEALR